MQPSPLEQAFDEWFRKLGFRGRHDLSGPTALDYKTNFEICRETYNEAFGRERRFPEHADHLPLHLDYIDTDEGVENAIATHDERYAFVGITLPLVFRISMYVVI